MGRRFLVRYCSFSIAVGVTIATAGIACSSFSASEDGPRLVDTPETSPPPPPPGDSAVAPVDSGLEPVATDPYSAAVLADKPIAYFRFEETTGASPKNEIPTSAVTALLSSNVTVHVEGISPNGHAVQLDTSTASVSAFEAMNFAGDDDFTVEAWVVLGSTTNATIFKNMDNEGADERVGQWLLLSSGTLRSETWNLGQLIFGADLVSAPIQSWTHVVFLHSGAQNVDLVYANATVGTNYHQGTAARAAPASPLRWTGFQGRLDELAIYSTALSPTRILAHYQAR